VNITPHDNTLFLLLLAVLAILPGPENACSQEHAERLSFSLPIDTEQAAADWTITGAPLAVVTDEKTQAPAFEGTTGRAPWFPAPPAVITLKTPVPAPVVVQADVRLPIVVSELDRGRFSRASAAVGWQPAATADADAGNTLSLLTLDRGRYRDDVSYVATVSGATTRNARAMRRFIPLYTAADISPLMDDSVRTILERRAGALPRAHERVHRLRMEIRPTTVRFYANGRFVAEKTGPIKEGTVILQLRGKARVLGLCVRPLPETADRFVPVPLDDFLNHRGPPTPPSLAQTAGGLADVAGVPFVTSTGPAGEDNLDLAPSLYLHRMGNMRTGDSREAVHAPETLDVTRFTMRVPPRTYRRAWILAYIAAISISGSG